jgi:hypothetical protein
MIGRQLTGSVPHVALNADMGYFAKGWDLGFLAITHNQRVSFDFDITNKKIHS